MEDSIGDGGRKAATGVPQGLAEDKESRYAKIKLAAGVVFVLTAVGGPDRQPKRVLALHGCKNGTGAARQIAETIKPLDDQGKKQEEPVHWHIVGVVMLNVLYPI